MINMHYVKLLKGLKHKHSSLAGEPVEKKFRRLLKLKTPSISLQQLPYNPQWPQWFSQEQQRLRQQAAAIGLQQIEHIGSSAIAGMTSKNIIDIACVSPFQPDDDTVQSLLQTLGYQYYANSPIHETCHWYWRVEPQRCHVLHLAHESNPCFSESLLFRDYLRAEPEKKNQYQRYKNEALADDPDLFTYSVRKIDIYCDILAAAERWQHPPA